MMKMLAVALMVSVLVSSVMADDVSQWITYPQVGYQFGVTETTDNLVVDGRAWGAVKLRAELNDSDWVCDEVDVRDCVYVQYGCAWPYVDGRSIV